MAQTGNTATLINAGGWSGAITSIGELSQKHPALNSSTLSTSVLGKKTRQELIDLEPIKCDVLYEPNNAPPMQSSEQWIITFPFPPAATIVGTGFVTAKTSAQLVNNELMVGTFELQFDGQTGPLFTVSTDTFSDAFSTEFA